MSVRLALLGLAALVLATGCEIASAQGPDGGASAAPRRARDGGVSAAPRRARDGGAASDGGARRWRPRSDGGTGRPRRARDAGTVAITEAMDGGVGAPPSTPPDAAAGGTWALAGDGGTGLAPDDAAAGAWLDAGMLVPADGSAPEASLEGGVAPELDQDAGALEGDAGGLAEDAGVAVTAVNDAGTSLGAAPAPPPALPPWLDPWELFARERSARDADAREDDDDRDDERDAPATPIVNVLPGSDGAAWERLEELVPALPGRSSGLALIALIALAALGARWIARTRRRLPERGAIPRVLALVHALLRIAIALLVLGVLAQLLPDWARPALPWVVVATAVALGWSARDLLPDLVAGAVLLAERRLTRGEHVAVGDHNGVVIEVGLRVTTLRDGEGRTVQVPNRVVLATPTATRRAGWHEIRVRVRATEGTSGDAFARALRDAVLLSPYVPVPTRAEVARDPDEPRTYVVRATLLDARFEERFRGELVTRAEKILAASTPPAPPASRPTA